MPGAPTQLRDHSQGGAAKQIKVAQVEKPKKGKK